jgi:hypothetical protein
MHIFCSPLNLVSIDNEIGFGVPIRPFIRTPLLNQTYNKDQRKTQKVECYVIEYGLMLHIF